ncbi:hypothetical protein PR048_020640 [Dryococelus australis]|uniref:Uncharacterized protein n=1 Tax=Dryococelus australis TaxID=614101 RepID=A0ABQ9H6X5_9NEOP|nr:hypothetical protein PR048_020640 [Dryococelus australis]
MEAGNYSSQFHIVEGGVNVCFVLAFNLVPLLPPNCGVEGVRWRLETKAVSFILGREGRFAVVRLTLVNIPTTCDLSGPLSLLKLDLSGEPLGARHGRSVEARLSGHHDRSIVQEISYQDRHEPPNPNETATEEQQTIAKYPARFTGDVMVPSARMYGPISLQCGSPRQTFTDTWLGRFTGDVMVPSARMYGPISLPCGSPRQTFTDTSPGRFTGDVMVPSVRMYGPISLPCGSPRQTFTDTSPGRFTGYTCARRVWRPAGERAINKGQGGVLLGKKRESSDGDKPEADSRRRLTTAGHTHLHILLVRCPDDKRRRSQFYVGLYRASCLISSAPFTGPVEGVSETVFLKVLSQSRSCHGSMFEGVIKQAIQLRPDHFITACRQSHTTRLPSRRSWFDYRRSRSPDFHVWESCRMMPLVGEFSRGSPVALAFPRSSTLTSLPPHRLSRPRAHLSCLSPPLTIFPSFSLCAYPVCTGIAVVLMTESIAPHKGEQIVAHGNRAGRLRWSAGFPCILLLAPCPPRFTLVGSRNLVMSCTNLPTPCLWQNSLPAVVYFSHGCRCATSHDKPNNDVFRFLRSKAGLHHPVNVLACWQSGVCLQTPRPKSHIDVLTIFHILQHHGERNTCFEPSFGINGNTVAIFDSPACHLGYRQLIRRYAHIPRLVHLATAEKVGDAIEQVNNSIAHYFRRCWIGPILCRQSPPDSHERLARKNADILVLNCYPNPQC